MADMLYECCEITVQLLRRLLEEKKITEEEYNRHVKLKLEYMESLDKAMQKKQ
jgi:hypothetical protein